MIYRTAQLVPLGMFLLLSVAAAQTDPPPAQPQGVEVLARGPVHEAYAEPLDAQPQLAPVVPKQPPDPIEEMPPDQKPDGDNVVWIPGYWGWADDQNDFVWVSGFWREQPPNRQWMPGHWQEVEGGWQWTAGFWAAANLQEVQYVPAPPPSVDTGPSVPAPDASSTYTPGCWIYRDSRFMWRPGFWLGYRPGWMWTPDHYIATTGGCLFVDGYWDHPLEERGLLFAPVRLAPQFLAGGAPYVPQYVVQPDFLMSALFAQPRWHHYFFGDYFDPTDAKRGYIPWMDYRPNRFSYDPNFAYYRQRFASVPGWEQGLRQLYTARATGQVPRPPQTLFQQDQIIQRITADKTGNLNISKNLGINHFQNVQALAPLAQVPNMRATNLASLANLQDPRVQKLAASNPMIRLAPVPNEQRVHAQQAARQTHAVAQQRQQVESKLLSEGKTPLKHTDVPQSVKMKLPGRSGPTTQPAPKSPVHPEAKPPVQPRPAVKTPPAPHPEGKPPVQPKPAVKTPPPRPEAKPPVQPRPAVKTPPPAPVMPKHESRPIPSHQPIKPPAPPRAPQAQPKPAVKPPPHPQPPPKPERP